MMRFYINTYGRIDNQVTLESLPKGIRERTFMVVQDSEAGQWKRRRNRHDSKDVTGLLVLPPGIVTLSPTRQWTLEHAADMGYDKIAIMDDDLEFFVRSEPGKLTLKPCAPIDVYNMFAEVERFLDTYIHAGVSARETNRFCRQDYRDCGALFRFLAYRPKEVLATGARFDRLTIMQGVDMSLQLISKGFNNRITYRYAHIHGKPQEAGGVSTYRTAAVIKDSMKKFAELNYPFIVGKGVIRKNLGKMTEEEKKAFVRYKIGWQKALAAGTTNPLLIGDIDAKQRVRSKGHNDPVVGTKESRGLHKSADKRGKQKGGKGRGQ